MSTPKKKETVKKTSKAVVKLTPTQQIMQKAVDDGSLDLWLSIGYNEEQIIQKIGISRSAYYSYKDKIRGLLDTFEKYKTPIVDRLLHSALEMACGYDYYEEQVAPNGQVVQVKKHMHGNNRMLGTLLHNYTKELNKIPTKWTTESSEVQLKELELKQKELEQKKEATSLSGMTSEIDAWLTAVKGNKDNDAEVEIVATEDITEDV